MSSQFTPITPSDEQRGIGRAKKENNVCDYRQRKGKNTEVGHEAVKTLPAKPGVVSQKAPVQGENTTKYAREIIARIGFDIVRDPSETTSKPIRTTTYHTKTK